MQKILEFTYFVIYYLDIQFTNYVKEERKTIIMSSEYLTFKEAMKYLGIKAPLTLRSYIDAGLPVIEVGKSKKISKSDIDEFMSKHKRTAQHETTI